MRIWAACVLLALSASQGVAQETLSFTCDNGPLTKTASVKTLVKAFGAANVKWTGVLWQPIDGETTKVTQIYPDTSDKLMVVHWTPHANSSGRDPREIRTGWGQTSKALRGPFGVHIGMTLEDLETINGRPFKLTLWNADVDPGWVVDWQGGTLNNALKNCSFGVQLGSESDAPDTGTFPEEGMSNDPKVRAAHPVVWGMSLDF